MGMAKIAFPNLSDFDEKLCSKLLIAKYVDDFSVVCERGLFPEWDGTTLKLQKWLKLKGWKLNNLLILTKLRKLHFIKIFLNIGGALSLYI